MKKHSKSAKDASAEAFYGSANADFSSQVDRFAEHDPRLRELFHRTRDHYLAKAKYGPSNPNGISGSA